MNYLSGGVLYLCFIFVTLINKTDSRIFANTQKCARFPNFTSKQYHTACSVFSKVHGKDFDSYSSSSQKALRKKALRGQIKMCTVLLAEAFDKKWCCRELGG